MTKAFAYMRVSGPSQPDGDGFPRQQAAIAAWCKANDHRVIQWFAEQTSGETEWSDRTKWVEMISALNGVRVIVIEKLDRLSRDLGVQEHIMRDLRKRNITIISTCEPDLGSTDPTRVLFRQIMGAIAQYDRAMITAKMAAARKRMKEKTGKCEGRKAFGDHPGELGILERLKELRSAGNSYQAIAERLNVEGTLTRYGRQWSAQTVCKILSR